MHEKRTMKIRNPGKPGREILPTEISIEELRQRWSRVAAIEHETARIEAERESAKSKAKAELDKLAEERSTLWKEIKDETVDRTVSCEYLVDEEQGYMYVRRLDTGALVRRREFTKQERLAASQGNLFEQDAPTRTLDVFDDIETVKRFDSDTPDVGKDEPETTKAKGDTGHECTFNEGACITCGKAEPEDEEGGARPVRRKGGKGKGYDTRAGAH